MTTEEQLPSRPHDDSAWPPKSLPVSVVVGIGALAGGATLSAYRSHVVLSEIAFVAAALAGAALLAVPARRWLLGAAISRTAPVVSIAVTVVVLVTLGFAALLGMAGGMMLANVWVILAARRNRPPAT